MKKIILIIHLFTLLLVFTTLKTYAQWTQCKGLENASISSFASIGNNLFAGLSGGDVYISKDSGATWSKLATLATTLFCPDCGLVFIPSINLFADSTNLFAGVGSLPDTGSVLLSTDNGLTWTEKDPGFSESVNCFTKNAGIIFAGTDNGVFSSTDYGASWNASSTGLNYGNYDSIDQHAPQVIRIAAQGKYVFAATTGEGVFRSTNSGASWGTIDNGLTNLSIYGFAIITFETGRQNIFAGAFQFPGDSTGGVFLSFDYGMNWQAVNTGMTNHMLNVLISDGTNLYTGNNIGVFLSTNFGGSWRNISPDTLPGPHDAGVLEVYGAYLFADNWRIPLSQLFTGVKDVTRKLPSGYVLEQNYPNPFNPSTRINYSVPITSLITIKIYDILGNEVAALVNEEKPAGNYSIEYNAGKLSNGVYFYRMQAGSFAETKKFLLLK